MGPAASKYSLAEQPLSRAGSLLQGMCWAIKTPRLSQRSFAAPEDVLVITRPLWRASLLALGRAAAPKPANRVYQTHRMQRFPRLLRSRTRASSLATGFVLTSRNTQTPVGVSLLAMGPAASTYLLADQPLSRAGSLLQEAIKNPEAFATGFYGYCSALSDVHGSHGISRPASALPSAPG